MEIAAKFSSCCLSGHKGNLFEWLFVCVCLLCMFVKLHENCRPNNHNFLSFSPSHMPFCLDWFGLVLSGFALGLCCSMCLCRAVNEIWKNDNKYYNQISTCKMTSSRKLLNSVLLLPTIYLHRIIHTASGGDGPFPFHSICNYKANCFNIIISSFLRAHTTQLIIQNLFPATTEFHRALSKLLLPCAAVRWRFLFHHPSFMTYLNEQRKKFPQEYFFHINRHHSMIERLNVHFERSFPFNAYKMSFQFECICSHSQAHYT